ncbi:MAG TPA: carboxylesterase family protein [Rhizomicrobium sp.]|nr:carboxylesterase family protein [Rhizomicrobium sp.]
MRRLALAAALILFGANDASAAKVALKIDQGILNGDTEDDVQVFKNIPYVAAPIGDLRWRAPQAGPHWTGARDATDFGPICPQNPGQYTKDLKQSEDCLSLNVWSPNTATSAKLPVMVWIYGGAFVTGGSALQFYDGTDLAKRGVVIVTFNYRLGELGFFAHPALASEHASDEATGNFGLLDQIAALKWVRANIAAFGGDPDNVTIFGESAGGMSVNDLMASPMARGLFAKAISESGLGLNEIPSLEKAVRASTDWGAAMGVTGSDAAALTKLRAIRVEDILKHRAMVKTEGGIAPFLDGKIVTGQVSVQFSKGEIAKVPYIAGSNSNEASLAPAIGADPVKDLSKFGDALPAVRAIYEADGKLTDEEFGRQVFGDALFTAAAQDLAGFVDKAGSTARVYQFAYVADHYRGKVPGVGHAGEIPFVFGFRGLGFLAHFTSDADRKVAQQMGDYWTNFAKTGDPNGAGLPSWPSFSDASRETLVVDDTTQAVADFRRGQVGVMTAAWAKRIEGAAGP